MRAAFAVGIVVTLATGCAGMSTPPPSPAPTSAPAPAPAHAACRTRADALLAKMTLDEKLGQMVQAERKVVEPGDVAKYFLGSILSGGGSSPGAGTPAEWADMTDALHADARTTRLGIPLLYASDAVHGHNNVVGATIFPHQIGLGCTRDPALVEAVARASAEEIAGTGVDWTFAPLVGPARDPRWGRFFETFSDDPELTALLGAAAVRGYQTDRLGGSPTSVLACAKHFAGDGLTVFGTSPQEGAFVDRGDVRMTDDDFMRVAVSPYKAAIAAGVGSVMVSFSSLRGTPMHENKKLVTDVLKGQLGFSGIVISDWSGLRLLRGSYYEQVVASVNAGIDVTMDAEKFYWRDFLRTAKEAVQKGDIPAARVDDAVRRILSIKCELGVFDRPQRTDRRLTAQVGSAEHRALARRAARASFVLLRNEGDLLPIAKTAKLVVTGSGASSLARQAGGWTVDWRGAEGKTFPGTTILEALRAAGDPARVSTDPTARADVAIVVVSEPPYAEWYGDSKDIALSKDDVASLDRAHESGIPVVVVILSGRPLAIQPHLRKARAWLAAWLPGSEGAAIADVVFGDAAPTGKLAHAWPARADSSGPPLFPFGHGLSYTRPTR